VPLTAFFAEVYYLLPSHAVGLGTRWPDSFARIYEFAMDTGDLHAILALFDRLEGKPRQQVEVKEESEELEFHTLAEVRNYLLEFGIDIAKLPNPMVYLDEGKRN
jgi:hypothetical protein